MSTATDFDVEVLEGLDFEVACEIRALAAEYADSKSLFPDCKGDKAEWAAWRTNCCPYMPPYRLMCDFCKKAYQRWQKKGAHISCPRCNKEIGGYVAFTPLQGRA